MNADYVNTADNDTVCTAITSKLGLRIDVERRLVDPSGTRLPETIRTKRRLIRRNL